MKKIYVLVGLMCFSFASAQSLHIDAKKNNLKTAPPDATLVQDDMVLDANGNLGLGTMNPGAKLDVRGDVKVGTTLRLDKPDDLNGKEVSPLFIDDEGRIGKANVSNTTELAYFSTFSQKNRTEADVKKFNEGKPVEVSFLTEDLKHHFGDVIEIQNSYLKIKKDGYYQISFFINPMFSVVSEEKDLVYFRGNISYSSNGGKDWENVVGIRPIIKATLKNTYYPQVFPTTIVSLKKGDLIRLYYSRSLGGDGGVQGSRVADIYLSSNDNIGLFTLQFSISKL